MNLLFVDSESFELDYGPVVFPASSFPRKNLGVDLCDYLHYFLSLFDSVFTAQRGKELRLVNYILLNWCSVVLSFLNSPKVTSFGACS